MSQPTKRKDLPTIRCQQILDYLNKYGDSTATQIAKGLKYSRSTVVTYLYELRSHADVQMYMPREGDGTLWLYRALVSQTRVTRKPVDEPVQPKATRSYVHLGTQKPHPIPNQRGQGAVRSTPTLASSADFN